MELEDVKSLIKALIVSYPKNHYSIEELLRDFQKEAGIPMPVFAFKNELEFLNSLTDIIKVKGRHPFERIFLIQKKRLSHIDSLVKRQNKKSPAKTSDPSAESTSKNQCGKAREKVTAPAQPEQSNSKNVPAKVKAAQSVEESTSSLPNKDSNKNLSPKSMEQPGTSQTKKKGFNVKSEFSKSSSSSNQAQKVVEVNDKVKAKLKVLMSEQKKGIWCCDLPELYHKRFNSVLDYREYGYRSLIEMITELTEIFRYIRPDKGDWLLFDAARSPSQEENQMMEKLMYSIPEDVENRILETITEYCKNKNGIYTDDFLVQYYMNYKEKLRFSDFGFSSIKCFLIALEDRILIIDKSDDRWILKPYVREPPFPEPGISAIPPITPDDNDFLDLFPPHVVLPHETFKKLDIKKYIPLNKKVSICVADVWSPTKFFIQLGQFKSTLDELMDEMQKFYDANEYRYKMPYQTIQPGQICATVYKANPNGSEEWHRGVIEKIVNEKYAMIHLVDFGTYVRKENSTLRFLHRIFFPIPVLAYRASLCRVVPKGSVKWSLEACQKFLEYFIQAPFAEFIALKTVCEPKVFLTGEIICTVGKKKINLNKTLVKEEYAAFSSEIDVDKIAKIPNSKKSRDEEKDDEPSDCNVVKESKETANVLPQPPDQNESKCEAQLSEAEISALVESENDLSVKSNETIIKRILDKYKTQFPLENKMSILAFIVLSTEETVQDMARIDLRRGLVLAKKLGTLACLYDLEDNRSSSPNSDDYNFLTDPSKFDEH